MPEQGRIALSGILVKSGRLLLRNLTLASPARPEHDVRHRGVAMPYAHWMTLRGRAFVSMTCKAPPTGSPRTTLEQLCKLMYHTALVRNQQGLPF